jgi:uncharacterized protein YkwD
MASSSFRSLVAVAGVTLAPLLAACSGNTGAADTPSQANPLDPEESAVVARVNQMRTAANLPGVTVCYSLDVSASAHADDMRDNALPVGEPGSDGSTVNQRACTAGYKAACPPSTPAMAEVDASGYSTGDEAAAGWAADPTSGPILKNPALIVVGVGRSLGLAGYYWTMDLGGVDDPSCTM